MASEKAELVFDAMAHPTGCQAIRKYGDGNHLALDRCGQRPTVAGCWNDNGKNYYRLCSRCAANAPAYGFAVIYDDGPTSSG